MITKTIIQTFIVRFDLNLFPSHIRNWRGAIVEAVGRKQDLFHNHMNDISDNRMVQSGLNSQLEVAATNNNSANGSSTTIIRELPKTNISTKRINQEDVHLQRYPLIHYRSIKGKAAILAINEAIIPLRAWLLKGDKEIKMRGSVYPLMIDALQEKRYSFQLLPSLKTYRLMDYVPFKQDNYQKWLDADNLIERIQLLETVLTGHILGFATAMAYRLPDRLEVKLMNMRETKSVKLHDVRHLAFNLVFKTNLDLPPGIALGRGVAFGYGVQQPTIEQNNRKAVRNYRKKV